jgi:hypothetical protein
MQGRARLLLWTKADIRPCPEFASAAQSIISMRERSKTSSKQFGNHARGARGAVVFHRLKVRRSSEGFDHRLCNHFRA